MTPNDPFQAQAAVDTFCRTLGKYAAKLDRSETLDRVLDAAGRHGWTAARLAEYLVADLPDDAGPGLVMLRAKTLSAAPEPAPITRHQREAMANATAFVQPLAPCGACDGTPARWRDVTPAGYQGQTLVRHCGCWTAPPGYVMPAERHRRNRERWAVLD